MAVTKHSGEINVPIADGYNRNGLISPSIDTTPKQPLKLITVTPEDYRGAVVDNRWTPINTLLEHLEGKSWTVDWYSQVLDRDSQLNGQQVSSSAVVNQYKKITSLEMKVTQDLTQSQDPETKTMTYAGSSLIYSGLIPNEGDMFVAQIGDGQLATFRVASSAKKSIFKQTAYEVTYNIGTTDPVYLNDLYSKVVATYVFRKDFLTHGQNPVIIQSDSAIFEDLGSSYARLCKQYFPRFFNRDYMSMTVPWQAGDVYDPFLVKFIKKMFTISDHYLIQQIRALNTDDDPVMNQSSIWDALANADRSYIDTGFTTVGLVNVGQFAYDPFFSSIRYTGVDYCLYPVDSVSGVTVEAGTRSKVIDYTALGASNPPGSYQWVPSSNTSVLGSSVASEIYPVTADSRYVFSNEFYTQSANQSGLEAAVSNYLSGGKPDIASLANSAKLFNTWGVVEQYYYVPIVLVLIRAAFRTYQG